MTRSKLLWFSILVLATIAVVCINGSASEYGWQPMIVGVPAIISAIGLAFENRWSEFASYATFALAGFVLLRLTLVSWPVAPSSVAQEFFPSAVLIAIFCGAVAAIYSFFRSN